MNKKVVWITGASSGIGKSLAFKFAKEGWEVAASARRKNLLEELKEINNNIKPFPLDITKNEDVKETFKKMKEQELPKGHPERIALEAQMKVRTPPKHDGEGGATTSIKIEDIETVNQNSSELAKLKRDEEMNMAAYLAYLDQQKIRKAYLDNYRQMFLANKGGLAGLFRVKNT